MPPSKNFGSKKFNSKEKKFPKPCPYINIKNTSKKLENTHCLTDANSKAKYFVFLLLFISLVIKLDSLSLGW